MDIKHLRPNKNSHYRQGYINPASCVKLFESLRNQPIIYRSSWEKRFIYWCESSPKVKHWGSECISIKYFNTVDQKEHTYYPDFVVEMVDGRKVVVEIKPECQSRRPNPEDEYNYRAYQINMSKWLTIKHICEEKGYQFWILTENTISKM